MKHIILIMNIILYSNTIFAIQDLIPTSTENQYDKIIRDEITINGIIILGNNVSTILQEFGQPETIEDYFFEIDDVMSQKYCYEGLILYIINDLVDSFVITGSAFSFTNHNIKVGDNLDSIESIYPSSYGSRTIDGGIAIDIEGQDLYLNISFDVFDKNNAITAISSHSF